MVVAHQSWLGRLLLSLVGPATAEDLVQETFVRAFLAIGRLRRGSFRPWIRVIALRLAYNARRDAQTRARYHAAYEHAPRGLGLRDEDQTAEREALMQALGQVSYPYREILVLRYLEELPLKDIAEVLNIGLSAAKMRLHRAREELKSHYDVETNDG